MWTIKGYFARPANISGKLPTVLVIHENRGLNPYVEDVADAGTSYAWWATAACGSEPSWLQGSA